MDSNFVIIAIRELAIVARRDAGYRRKNFPRLKPRLKWNFSLGSLWVDLEIDVIEQVSWRAIYQSAFTATSSRKCPQIVATQSTYRMDPAMTVRAKKYARGRRSGNSENTLR